MILLLLQLSLLSFLNKPVDLWLNDSISGTEFISILEEQDNIIPMENNYDYFLKKSFINFYIGKVYFNDSKKDISIKYFEESIELANRAVELKETSEALGIIAESGSYIMLQKGLPYIIQNSKKINDTALKAIELDKNNIRATIIVANGLINAPGIFGGDKKKGIKMLLSIDLSEEPNELKYSTYIALGNVYKSLKDKDSSRKYYKECLNIYPGNIEVKKLLLALEG